MKGFGKGTILGRRVLHIRQPQCLALSRSLSTSQETSNVAIPSEPSIPKLPEPVDVNLERKTVSTVVGDLPLSPLMDPAHYEARKKWRGRKQPESTRQEKTKIRKAFERNPYIHALTTPVRRCVATRSILPRFFLQGFRIMYHPETGVPYYIPTDLEPSGLETEQRRKQKEALSGEASTSRLLTSESSTTETSASPSSADITTTAPDAPNPAPPQPETTPTSQKKPSKSQTGPTGYMLARKEILDQILTQGSPYFNKHTQLMSLSAHPRTAFLTEIARKAIWREDMGSYILSQMRNRIVQDLLYFADLMENPSKNYKYLTTCTSWDDIPQLHHRGCVLFFSDLFATDAMKATTLRALEPPSLPPFSTMDIENVRLGSKLPVHDMRHLLGEDHIGKLRDETSFFRNQGLFLLGRERTNDLQLRLWKLQNYLTPLVAEHAQGREAQEGEGHRLAGNID